MINVSLIEHPGAPTDRVKRIDIEIRQDSPDTIELRYRLEGDLAALHLPPFTFPRRGDLLWHHSCFEAFFRPSAESRYVEFNFSSSGEWAMYRFDRYRERGEQFDGVPPTVLVRRTETQLDLEVVVGIGELTQTSPASRPRLGLSAIIEDVDGARSFWALKHVGDKPDFHHENSFAIELEP